MKQILIVEDNKEMQGLLRDYLTHEGYAVKTYDSAASAVIALSRDSRKDIGAIISDFMMPGMNGLQLLDWSRVVRPEVGRVLISAYGDADLACASRRICAEYLVKPFKLKSLAEALSRATQSP